MRHLQLIFLASLVALSLTGCFSLGLEGESSEGEEGRTEWSIEDGLCPGLAGDCALDVPLAVGASTTLHLEVDGRESLDGIEVSGEGAVSVDDLVIVTSSDSDRRPYARVDVTALEPGEGTLVVRDGSGEIDRARLTVRAPAAIECGRYPEVEVLYPMDGLEPATELTIRRSTADSSRAQLVCRALDADDRPLLTVRAIEWTLVETDGSIELDAGGLFTAPGDSVSGARVYAQLLAPGSSVVEARLGDLSWEIAITVE